MKEQKKLGKEERRNLEMRYEKKKQMTEAILEWAEDQECGLRPETVLKQCRRRIKYLDTVLPCYENKRVLWHLDFAIHWEERRNKRRKEQNVQGTMKEHTT